MLGGSYIGTLDSPGSSIGGLVQPIAQATINRMVYRDNPLFNQNLQTPQILGSILEVIRQMKVAGASVLAMTVTAAAGTRSAIGNGPVNRSVRRPLDGKVLENAFAETIRAVCISDSYTGGATSGRETFALTGSGKQGDLFAHDWPLGSNCSTSLSAIDGSKNNSAGNILTNSAFNSWATGDVLNNFTLDIGTAGTHTVKETSLVYDGAAALRLVGDGSNLTQLSQKFNISTGTSGTLSPLTQYSVNVFARRDGTAAGAGVLTIELVDQNGTIINDANGAANRFTIDLTALTTVYTQSAGVFRTPNILPTSQYFRLRLSTALTSGRAVYLDKMSMGKMTQAYRGGTYFAIHSGSTPFVINDYISTTITNSRGAGGTLNTWQTAFFRLCDPFVAANEIILPSSSTPTISDNLLT